MKNLNKVKWVVGILVVFFLILATNLIDRSNFRVVKESVVSVYEDRLVAKGLLFDLQNLMHKKEQAIAQNNLVFFEKENDQINQNITDLLAQYDKTILTKKESEVYATFKRNVSALITSEKNLSDLSQNQKTELYTTLASLKIGLSNLAQIQQEEGKNQLDVSQSAFNTIELFTQMEIFLLIVLALVMQAIILYQPKDSSKGKYKVLNPRTD